MDSLQRLEVAAENLAMYGNLLVGLQETQRVTLMPAYYWANDYLKSRIREISDEMNRLLVTLED